MAPASPLSPGADASEAVPDLTDQVPVADLTETLVDSDGDGLTDGYEATIGLDPMNRNTDGDGYTDHDELNDLGGGNPFVDEGARDTWSNGPCESPSEPPPRSWPSNVGPPLIDEDNDGIHDWDERKWVGTDPTDSDTDDDGILDGKEWGLGLDPTNPDTDGDGLSDHDEVWGNTNPSPSGTDGDGVSGGDEVAAGTDPLDATDWIATE